MPDWVVTTAFIIGAIAVLWLIGWLMENVPWMIGQKLDGKRYRRGWDGKYRDLDGNLVTDEHLETRLNMKFTAMRRRLFGR